MVERRRDQKTYADHKEHQATTVYPAADVRNACEHLLERSLELKAEQNLCTENEEARLVERELELPFGERRHGERTEAMTSRMASAGDPPGRTIRLQIGLLHLCLAGFLGFGSLLAFGSDVLQFVVSKMFNSDERVVSDAHPDQLVEPDLDRRTVPVLRVLDQEDHQEGNDRRPGIDDELPRVRETKHRA